MDDITKGFINQAMNYLFMAIDGLGELSPETRFKIDKVISELEFILKTK